MDQEDKIINDILSTLLKDKLKILILLLFCLYWILFSVLCNKTFTIKLSQTTQKYNAKMFHTSESFLFRFFEQCKHYRLGNCNEAASLDPLLETRFKS